MVEGWRGEEDSRAEFLGAESAALSSSGRLAGQRAQRKPVLPLVLSGVLPIRAEVR